VDYFYNAFQTVARVANLLQVYPNWRLGFTKVGNLKVCNNLKYKLFEIGLVLKPSLNLPFTTFQQALKPGTNLLL